MDTEEIRMTCLPTVKRLSTRRLLQALLPKGQYNSRSDRNDSGDAGPSYWYPVVLFFNSEFSPDFDCTSIQNLKG
jgi:hypothetical protein